MEENSCEIKKLKNTLTFSFKATIILGLKYHQRQKNIN